MPRARVPPRVKKPGAARAAKGARRGGARLPDLRERVADCLAAFADELPGDIAAPEAVYEEWMWLALALAHGALVEPDLLTALGAELGCRSPDADWRALIGAARRLHPDGPEAGASAFQLLEALPAGEASLAALRAWLADLAARAGRGEGGVARELGGLHEILLGLGFARLERYARRLRRSRAWLSPEEVLGWEPARRSKQLQRALGLSKHSVHALRESLSSATNADQVERCLATLLEPQAAPRQAGRCVLRESSARRSSGSHYTPWALTVELVERALAPLLARLPEPKSQALLSLRICDPAMGAGVFLLACARLLEAELLRAWRGEGVRQIGEQDADAGLARRLIVTQVLRGVDKSRAAVSLARLGLSLFAWGRAMPAALQRGLVWGDALVERELGPAAAGQAPALDWAQAFGDVFERDNPGFDAMLGNPPWVAYVGRAAQPLAPALAAHYAATSPAFRRYRTLHGLFVHRSAALLRDGGRLGLVLPTSVADLEGYAPTRSAHDALCRVDAELPDWGDGAFEGVFQPSMALLSTRDRRLAGPAPASAWPLCNDELGATELGLVERLSRLERLPRELFGERGFQTTEDDQAHLLRSAGGRPDAVALREGADVGEFRALPPQLFGDRRQLGARLRPDADWAAVKLLIRQTARFPMAALSDGRAFRNSILAGYETPEYPAPLLLALLNSSLYRFLHYNRQRDARQGMPQLKIGHLRALPAPPRAPPLSELERLGRRLGEANAGLDAAARLALDALVNELFSLSPAERDAVATWTRAHPPPQSRRQAAATRPAAYSASRV